MLRHKYTPDYQQWHAFGSLCLWPIQMRGDQLNYPPHLIRWPQMPCGTELEHLSPTVWICDEMHGNYASSSSSCLAIKSITN